MYYRTNYMKNKTKFRLLGWLIYSVILYMLNIQYQVWFTGIDPALWSISIPYSILLGFIFTVITEILIELLTSKGERGSKNIHPKNPFKCPYGNFSCTHVDIQQQVP